MLYVRKDVPFKLLPDVSPEYGIENLFIEMNLRSKIVNCLTIFKHR